MTEAMGGAKAIIVQRLMSLGNAVLQAAQTADDIVDFKCSSESKGFMGKKQSFEARMKVDEAKKEIRYWEKISESSKGFGSGDDMGYGKPSFVLKGLDRSGTGEGFAPDGAKFKYDLGKVEEYVKSIAKQNSWGFKKSIMKP